MVCNFMVEKFCDFKAGHKNNENWHPMEITILRWYISKVLDQRLNTDTALSEYLGASLETFEMYILCTKTDITNGVHWVKVQE